jgi:hypothetical protein
VSCREQALSIAEILRDHVGDLPLNHEQGKAVAHILACRTGRLGGHVAFCDRCGARHYAYHSCLMVSNSLWRVEPGSRRVAALLTRYVPG